MVYRVKNCNEVKEVNLVGKYAQCDDMDELQLMKMVFELPEKDRMLMWLQGYIDLVIDRLPTYAKDILENRKSKWEDTKEYVREQLASIVNQELFIEATKRTRKEFALFVKDNFPQFQSLLFKYLDGNLKDSDFRKFVYQSRFGHKRYLS
jgi:hypothetical protein